MALITSSDWNGQTPPHTCHRPFRCQVIGCHQDNTVELHMVSGVHHGTFGPPTPMISLNSLLTPSLIIKNAPSPISTRSVLSESLSSRPTCIYPELRYFKMFSISSSLVTFFFQHFTLACKSFVIPFILYLLSFPQNFFPLVSDSQIGCECRDYGTLAVSANFAENAYNGGDFVIGLRN